MSDPYGERRERRREYQGDVFYDVWRSGGNPDAINIDRVEDHFCEGDRSEEAAADELQHQRERSQHD